MVLDEFVVLAFVGRHFVRRTVENGRDCNKADKLLESWPRANRADDA